MALYIDIWKKYRDFELKIKFECGNEVISLLGASGAGKSLTLKCIAGIVKPDEGRIVLDGRVLFDSKEGINLPIQDRRVGLMFQNYALFPDMNVYDNIRYSIRKKDLKGASIDTLIDNVLNKMNLYEVRNYKISELSGGMMQRVALARILVNDADIIMLDEPMSALDDHLRFGLMKELSKVFSEFGKTVLFITHNRDEAYKLSDKIAIINEGRLDTIGNVDDIFANPHTIAGARLNGVKNIIEGFPGYENSIVGIRMHSIKTKRDKESDVMLECSIIDIEKTPFTYIVSLDYSGCIEPLYMEIEKDSFKNSIGDYIDVYIASKAIMVLGKNPC